MPFEPGILIAKPSKFIMNNSYYKYFKKAMEMPIEGLMPWIYNGIRDRVRHQCQTIQSFFYPFFFSKSCNYLFSECKCSHQELLERIKKAVKTRYLWSWEERELLLADFKKTFRKEVINQIIEDADRVCDHIFDFQGSGKKSIGKKINWRADLATGVKWPSYKSEDIPIFYKEGSDIVRIWELSRFQWGPTLGKAFWITGEEKYVDEFVDQVNHWCKKNPFGFGPNWISAQDVALRAINWIITLCFIGGSDRISVESWIKILSKLYLHGIFIEMNFSIRYRGDTRITGNHYISEILGLLYLGLIFKDTVKGKSWLKHSISELKSEIYDQVNFDGGQYESSIACYHKYVLEHFLAAYLLFLKNGFDVPDEFVKRLEKMFEFVEGYTRPDGTVPQIGDTADSKLYILSNYSNWQKDNHLFLIQIGARLFGRQDIALLEKKHTEEGFWLLYRLDKKGLIPSKNCIKRKNTFTTSMKFPESGFYFMKHQDAYMAISANPVGLKGKGNHKHNDVLSFDLFVHGKSYIVDPGSYVYTSDINARNLFRSTSYHNTIMIDETEINPFENDNVFQMDEKAKPFVRTWISEANFCYFEGLHFGYTRLSNPMIHERHIFFSKTKTAWLIQDLVYPDTSGSIKEINDNGAKHNIVINFHYAPMELKKYYAKKPVIQLSEMDNYQDYFPLFLKNNGNIPTFEAKAFEDDKSLVLQILDSPQPIQKDISPGWVSPSYGIRVEAPILSFSGCWNCPVSFVYLISAFAQPTENCL